MIIKGIGSVTLYLDVKGESKAVCLKDVHHVPESGYNLFSVGVIESKVLNCTALVLEVSMLSQLNVY